MVLLGDKNSTEKSHYEVLCVNEDASYDEIRASYKAAILSSHPDKLTVGKLETSESHSDLQFLEVQKAWEVLSDPVCRSNYDYEFRASKLKSEVVANEVELGEMMVEMVNGIRELFYECRCGDYFSVTSSELLEMGICLDANGKAHKPSNRIPALVILPCGSCSLKIRLILDIES